MAWIDFDQKNELRNTLGDFRHFGRFSTLWAIFNTLGDFRITHLVILVISEIDFCSLSIRDTKREKIPFVWQRQMHSVWPHSIKAVQACNLNSTSLHTQLLWPK
jgi:hypothetical protein